MATLEKGAFLIGGNTDQTITFSFDEEWKAYPNKTVLFVYSQEGLTKYKSKKFTGKTVKAPLLTNINNVKIGVVAGEIMASTSVTVQSKTSVLDDAKINPEDIDDGYVDFVNAEDLIDELLSQNIFDKTKAANGNYIDVLTGASTESEEYYVTGYMPVELGKRYCFKTYPFFGENKAVVALYNKNKTYIGHTNASKAIVNKSEIAVIMLEPVITAGGYEVGDVKYCRVNFKVDELDTFMFYSGPIYPDEYEAYSRVVRLNEDVKLSDNILNELREMFVALEDIDAYATNSDLTVAVRNAVMFADENNTMQFKLDSDGGVKLIITEREAE